MSSSFQNYFTKTTSTSTSTSSPTFSLLVSLLGENETVSATTAAASINNYPVIGVKLGTNWNGTSDLIMSEGLRLLQNLTCDNFKSVGVDSTNLTEMHHSLHHPLHLTRNDTFDEEIVIKNSVEFLPLGCALWIVCLFGLVGNLLSAIVLRRPKMKSTYSILTLGLTFCDIVYLLMKLLRYGLLSLFDYFQVVNSYTEVIYPICGPSIRALTFTAHTGSNYFTIALAIDRYISVCWPVKARWLCTKRRAYLLGALVFLFSILYNVTRWMEFHTEVSTIFNATLNKNVTIYSMEMSTLRRNLKYKSLYIFWSYFLIIFFIPFTSLSFFNYKIFKEVRRSNKARRKLTSFQKREISFAMMLVSIVALFLICSADYLVIDLLTYFDQKYPPFWDQLGNFLLTVNSAGNFIIYCAFGRKFRQEFVLMMEEVLCCRQSKPRSEFGSQKIIPDLISGNGGGMRSEGHGETSSRHKSTRGSIECHCQRTVYL